MNTEPTAEAAGRVDGHWRRLPAEAGLVKGLAGGAVGVVLALLGAGATIGAVSGPVTEALVIAGSVPVGALLGAWVGRARWRRTRWSLDVQGLRVRHGLLWRTEVLVPRSRVQHLDIERGPLERQFGLATLVVHTAGSQTTALRQAGLADADAVMLRDAMIPETRGGDAL
jgi:uncharacterized protein